MRGKERISISFSKYLKNAVLNIFALQRSACEGQVYTQVAVQTRHEIAATHITKCTNDSFRHRKASIFCSNSKLRKCRDGTASTIYIKLGE